MKKLEGAPMIGAHIKIDLEGLGAFIIDGTVQPPVFVTDETTHIDTTLICAPETLNSILSGTQDPTLAYMMGKLKVQGSMGYALKLNSFLSD